MMPETRACRANRSHRAHAAGFTLIELMIVVVIATILLSIAFPMYLHQIRESRRTDARSALLDLAAREERYFATNSAYTPIAGNLGYPGFGPSYPVGNGQYYYLGVSVNNGATPPTYSLVATPISGKGQDQDADCATFTIDNTGKQSATGANPGTCWGQ